MNFLRPLHDFFVSRISNDLATALKIVKEVILNRYVFTYLLDGGKPEPAFAAITQEEINARFGEFPEETRAILWNYIRYINNNYHVPPPDGHYFFCMEVKKLYTFPFDEKAFIKERCAFAKVFRKYHFAFIHAGPESLLHHHGLKTLPPSVKTYMKNRDFIDAGAFVGDSSIVFCQYSPRKIYAFEPSRKNRESFQHYAALNHMPRNLYELVPMGVDEKERSIGINDVGGSSQTVDIPGELRVELTTVDRFAAEKNLRVGMIKADLEGMGLKMLKGALKTLQKDRPVLSIAIYHNVEEFLGVYEFLKSLNLNYHFEIQVCRQPVFELTLLAYPKELK